MAESRYPGARVTWWGHSTVLVDDGARVLTDPILTPWFAHLVRLSGETPDIDTLRADVVVLSHLHSDHLHVPSLRLLSAGTRTLVPRGGGVLLRGLALDVVEVDVGDEIVVGDTRITAVPAVHNGRRWQGSTLVAPTLGYLISGSVRTYFAGDTALFAAMADLRDGEDQGPDLALLPVWGWGPWLRGEHLDPPTAAEALDLIRPRVAVPIHWGTFWPRGMSRVRQGIFRGAGPEFQRHAGGVAPRVDVRVLAPGSSTWVPLAKPSS